MTPDFVQHRVNGIFAFRDHKDFYFSQDKFRQNLCKNKTKGDATGLRRFVVAHQNVRSLRNCVDKIEKLILELSVDIMCITEHWLSTTEIETTGVANFNLVSSFCRTMGQCGGAALFVRSGIKCKPRRDIGVMSQEGIFECAAAELVGKVKNYIFIVVYRPPRGDFKLFLELST